MTKQLRQAAMEERHKNERLAKQLSTEAMQQWQRSIEGLLALPTATALGLASTTLYVAAFIERGFEVLQQSTDAMRVSIEQGRREFQQMERSSARMGDRGEDRNRSEVHA
jgi:hypothetical protein